MSEMSLLPVRDYLYLPEGNDDLSSIMNDALEIMKTCELCPNLKDNGKVFMDGNPNANIMICGEAPAKDEIADKKLFWGKAGKILDQILKIPTIGLSRENVVLVNALKCKLPGKGNISKIRDPYVTEIDNCRKFLNMQIFAIKPKIILALGASAAKSLLGSAVNGKSIELLRQRIFSCTVYDNHYPVIVTYHPAAVLDRGDIEQSVLNERKQKIREDWEFAKEVYKEIMEDQCLNQNAM